MLRVAIVVLACLALGACSSSASSRRTPPPSPTATPTPDFEPLFLFDLDTLQKLTSVSVPGRIPLGLYNGVAMQFAGARFDRFFAGDDLPQDAHLHLSIVLGAPIPALMGADGNTHDSYQWWFYTTTPTDAQTATADHAASLKIGVRFVDGSWGVYADSGNGWARVAGATYQFGEYEVIAQVHVDPAWGMPYDTSTFFRAVTSVEGGFYPPVTDVGDIYPRDLSWRQAFVD